ANLIFSPFSIAQAFSMAMAGTDGATEQQIRDALHVTLSHDTYYPALGVLNSTLITSESNFPAGSGDVFQLNIANSLWAQANYPFRQPYLDQMQADFAGQLFTVDFISVPDEVRGQINDWVEDRTEDKIQDLLPPGIITPDTRMVLANAIYFKASWNSPFEEYNTEDDTFTLLDGATLTVPMMHQQESFGYVQGAGFQAVELPYWGGNVAMLAIVPDAGTFAQFEAGLNVQQFDTLRHQLTYGEVQLAMPRFEFATDLNLKPPMIALGVVDAFDPALADFSRMVDLGESLFISGALHKAYIGVDEAGTEAAAATALIMDTTAAPMPSEPVIIQLDRPFIYAIYDRATGSILFLGRVMNPA
ncbi:MAG: serpin family protein, partial [Anaerolineae bacterium]|nr:serpin family protein [Anaerolineae bacterium]